MKRIYLFCLLCIASLSLSAQKNEQQFKFDYTLQSEAFGDERTISVYLPPSYYRYPDSKFTVTYVLDGHFEPFINLGVKTIEYNNYMYNYTPTIVVGIHAKQRGWEFSAPVAGDEDDENYKGGRAPELQQHFKKEVFPLIDSLYADHLLPFRSIIGHSSGGAFVLYTLFSKEKDLFDSYIGISPALRPGENTILEDAVSQLKSGEKFPKFLYCSSGTISEREEIFGAAINRLDSILQVYPNHGLHWRKAAFEGMDHFTCVGPSFNAAMIELTRAFRIDEKLALDFSKHKTKSMTEQVEAFYKNCEDNYGFKEIPYGGYLSQIAQALSKKGNKQAALDLTTWALKHHPKHYRLLYAKANFQRELGDKKMAHKSFLHCLEVLNQIREEVGEERYTNRKEDLEEMIAKTK